MVAKLHVDKYLNPYIVTTGIMVSISSNLISSLYVCFNINNIIISINKYFFSMFSYSSFKVYLMSIIHLNSSSIFDQEKSNRFGGICFGGGNGLLPFFLKKISSKMPYRDKGSKNICSALGLSEKAKLSEDRSKVRKM